MDDRFLKGERVELDKALRDLDASADRAKANFRRRIEEIKAKRIKDAEYRLSQMRKIPIGGYPGALKVFKTMEKAAE